MTKPVVHYIGDAEFFDLEDEEGAFTFGRVFGVDHPHLGRGIIRTSEVLQKFDDGSFETRNTIYKPVKNEI